ncbi:MAG: hypothetical protein LUO98_07030 [Methanoregula sp.]|nr:hypothetical protein [Methanoregula sp.]
MPPDTDKKISALRDTAVGRCRERLEQAARKATSSSAITGQDESGFTSLLKRRHGL